MTAARRKGSAWETAIVEYLRVRGWPYAERRVTNGAKDRGDIAGVVGVVIEAKSAARIELGVWMAETEAEQRNAAARIGAVWVKRRGKGSPADGYVVMTGTTFTKLLREAGY